MEGFFKNKRSPVIWDNVIEQENEMLKKIHTGIKGPFGTGAHILGGRVCSDFGKKWRFTEALNHVLKLEPGTKKSFCFMRRTCMLERGKECERLRSTIYRD